MAPEQAIRGAMDARTDVFSLGCVLYALLTGKSPLADENALVDLLAGTELSLEPLPEAIAPLLARALRRNKAERFASAEEFALACAALVPRLLDAEPRTALRDWVSSVAPAPSRAVVRAVTPERPARRWPRIAIGLGSFMALTAAGVAFWPKTIVTTQPEPVPAPAPDVVVAVDAGPPHVEVAVPPPPPPPRVEGPRPAPVRAVPREQGSGVLAVGGETFLRAQVSIDGVASGFAPRRFELPVGEHLIEVVTPAGQRFGPRRLTITRQHTELSPLLWVE
jgi:serine/threonine-protein kinase